MAEIKEKKKLWPTLKEVLKAVAAEALKDKNANGVPDVLEFLWQEIQALKHKGK